MKTLFVKQPIEDRRRIASYTLEARLCEICVTELCRVLTITGSVLASPVLKSRIVATVRSNRSSPEPTIAVYGAPHR